jgi:hypothetical protein
MNTLVENGLILLRQLLVLAYGTQTLPESDIDKKIPVYILPMTIF